MITKIWLVPNLITKEMIYNSFRYMGIANTLNRKEDNLFNASKKMEEGNPLIENDIQEFKEEEFNDSDSDELNQMLISLKIKLLLIYFI